MKMLLKSLVILLAISTAQAATINMGTIDVGNTDTFILEAGGVGSPDSEATWVQTSLGDPTVDWVVSLANVDYVETSTAGTWAFSLLFEPDYFIVKNSNRIALFENVASLDWGVFDASLLSSGMNIPSDPWIISHVTELNKDINPDPRGNPVPEAPLTILLGIGLVGLGYIRKVRA